MPKPVGMAQFADIEADVLHSTVISVRPALNNCQATGRETWEVCVASNIGADCKVNFQEPLLVARAHLAPAGN